MRVLPVPALIHLADIACISPRNAEAIFWSLASCGRTKEAALIQFAVEVNRPLAQILPITNERPIL